MSDPIPDEIRRVWFSAYVMQTWTREVRPKLRKAYNNVGKMDRGNYEAGADIDGALAAVLLDLRPWFAGAVASIDEICSTVEVTE